MRRAFVLAGAIAAAGLIALVGWDFVKFGRQVPPLVAPEGLTTSIVVEKHTRRMTVFREQTPIKTYTVSLGRDPIGPKRQEGDGRTPEGRYKIDFKNQRSRFHLSLRISYPEAADRAQARQHGVSPGSDIMIHGLPNGIGWLQAWHLRQDWTDGCIAVTNKEIEEIWAMVDVGTVVEIRP